MKRQGEKENKIDLFMLRFCSRYVASSVDHIFLCRNRQPILWLVGRLLLEYSPILHCLQIQKERKIVKMGYGFTKKNCAFLYIVALENFLARLEMCSSGYRLEQAIARLS